MKTQPTKTLDDIKNDMSALYESVNSDDMELKKAAELANIAGKFLKAEQLQLGREIFLGSIGRKSDNPALLITNS